MEDLYICKTCGSEDIEQMGWVNLNTGLPNGSPYSLNDLDKNYCNNCGEHTIIVHKEIEDEES